MILIQAFGLHEVYKHDYRELIGDHLNWEEPNGSFIKISRLEGMRGLEDLVDELLHHSEYTEDTATYIDWSW